jgi:hypothetical protein
LGRAIGDKGKKLRRLVRHWTGGRARKAEQGPLEQGEAEALGLPAETFAEERNEDAPMLWPDMVDSWRLFMGMATQWRTAGQLGLRTGLEYGVLSDVAASLGIAVPLDRRVFADIRLMEAVALEEWTKRATRSRGRL